ncbi:MAG: ATP-binding cassette domain-containing protein [Candidatus Marinimicrobia bacterium]|nr:ATP-binding cassette domain-containing protein [Candidatus Neomarinimicrobiota bacterium]
MIELRKTTLKYQRGPGVYDINFTIGAGELVFLVGPSGAGKTTLLKLMYADLLPQEGEVEVNGFITSHMRSKSIPHLRRTLGLVFQDFRLLPDRNAYDNIALPLHILGLQRKDIRERTYAALDDVGLIDRAHHYPRELSGGEQQRVGIARAIVKNPITILADEPTGNLDAGNSMETLDLLTYLANENGSTVIIATHDYSIVSKKRGRLIEINEGRLLD